MTGKPHCQEVVDCVLSSGVQPGLTSEPHRARTCGQGRAKATGNTPEETRAFTCVRRDTVEIWTLATAANGVEFVEVQFANVIVEIGHVDLLFNKGLFPCFNR
jgi:hypothetical protein